MGRSIGLDLISDSPSVPFGQPLFGMPLQLANRNPNPPRIAIDVMPDGKRYGFWLGLLAVYFPLHAWRRAEDRRLRTTSILGQAARA